MDISKFLSGSIRGMRYYMTRNLLKPAHLTLLVTRRCNTRCIMCCLPETAGYELSLSEIKVFLEDETFHSVDCVTISGGEPFLRHDLPEIVFAIRETLPNLKYIFLLTNGLATSLIEKTIQDILSQNHQEPSVNLGITVSVLGITDDTYKKITSESNGYKRVTETIKTLLELRQKFPLEVRFNTVILPLNIKDVPQILKLSEKNDVSLRLTPVSPIPLDDPFFYREENKPYLTFNEKQISFLENFFAKPHKVISEYSRAYWSGFLNVWRGRKSKIPCSLLHDALSIDANGELFCCVAPLTYGNLRNQRASEILTSRETKNIRKNIRMEYCSRCFHPCGAESSIKKEFFYYFRFVLEERLNRKAFVENRYNL